MKSKQFCDRFSDKEALIEYLEKHNLKPTAQRIAIAEYVLNTCCHPTAEDIYNNVKDTLPMPISLATVYNTLQAFVSINLIQEVQIEPDKIRYDRNVQNHHHFVNSTNGEILDIEIYDLLPDNLIEKYIEQSHGNKMKINKYHITFYGEEKSI